jgi:hypothetical protein
MFVIMESKVVKTGNQEQEIKGLLPNYFKLIGLILIIVAFITAIIMKVKSIDVAQAPKALIKSMIVNGFILGLLFIAWARDKTEDERTNTLRLKSMGFVFILTALFVVVDPVTAVLFKTTSGKSSAQGLIISMLAFYLVLYYLQKSAKRSVP